MDEELSILETRMAALIDAYQSLRMENRELHTRVAALQADNERSARKLAEAIARIEDIVARLPEDE